MTVKPRRQRAAAGFGAATLVLAGLGVMGTSAYGASLPGSIFEIDTDANLIVDTAGNQDWASVPQGTGQGQERRKADAPSGQNDDSFGEGTKEDSPVPTVVSGSIPPQKSDLLNFGGYLETTAGQRFLNIFWHRVQEPQGTTNMDFEFNKSTTKSGNGVTPVRSAGDVLIQYDLSQGGTNPQLFLSRWVATGNKSLCEAANATPCWGTRVNLSAAGDAIGSINTSAITAANSDGLGPISPRTFGEAQIDFDALAGGTGQCVAFGSAYLKSRSSDSFTAAVKDFIAPIETNFSTCGSVKVVKQDDATPPNLLAGAEFDLLQDNAPLNNATGPGAEDTKVASCTTAATTGECSFSSIQQGEYWLLETKAPTGYDPATPAYQHLTVTADNTVTKTFTNPRQVGAIKIVKTAKHADKPTTQPNLAATFSVTGGPTTVSNVTTDGTTGTVCVPNLLFGTYKVKEVSGQTGYKLDADEETVVVDTKSAGCGATAAPETVSFENVPLSKITLGFKSLVPGGTVQTSITCTGETADSPTDTISGGYAAADTKTFTDLVPGTYNCTVVVDP